MFDAVGLYQDTAVCIPVKLRPNFYGTECTHCTCLFFRCLCTPDSVFSDEEVVLAAVEVQAAVEMPAQFVQQWAAMEMPAQLVE